MSRGSGNNPQLATNSGGGASSLTNQKWNFGGFNQIIFTSVINNYMISFSSSRLKVKMNGF